MKKKKICIAISGASGSIYASELIKKIKQLHQQLDEAHIIFSENAIGVWEHELGPICGFEEFKKWKNNSFYSPLASGSYGIDTMIIIPCSMGTIGKIANGLGNDLISRAADVVLKERKKLILVARETPYNLIHLRNMTSITEAGGIICPGSPSFYSKPQTINELVNTVVDRVLELADFKIDTYRWEG